MQSQNKKSKVDFKKNLFYNICFLLVVLILFILYFINFSVDKKSVIESGNASSTGKILTTNSDWDLGSKTNISATNSTIIISDVVSGAEIDLTQGVTITSSADSANQVNLVDNDETTWWNYSACVNGIWQPMISYWWQVDLGVSQSIRSVMVTRATPSWYYYPAMSLYYSDDGGVFSAFPQNPLSAPINAKYIKVVTNSLSQLAICAANLTDIKIISAATATHLSAPTQITNTNLYQWQTFTPTYTKPANTDISFRFRTSTDANTWTDWSAPQTPASGSAFDISSLVTSKTGDAGSETFYKYIQVETTLTSTDGVSTPTLSDYTVNYHTNVAPSAPTGLTAVVGE